ncbi:MAG TPA: VIT domain-containing protein, partial [Pirellulales bacterium]|nr:VIT domain-containing protein [Pirellulales bacterium]
MQRTLLLAMLGSIAVGADNAPATKPPAESAKSSLSADARLGRVTDVQGVVMVKPLAGERWLPLERLSPVMPGDWLQADGKGAHAATVELTTGNRITLGPGALAEFQSAESTRLFAGEASLTATTDHPLELSGPAEKPLRVVDRAEYRASDEKLARLSADPAWLSNFQSRSRETLGSLIAQVDGRNVALSVGQHTVTVDIRDQLARTVVEESFENHTDAQLEGVFSFPLPADASISGFGMWIGDELVEADVVEKQRAREIFETLLRERADPALLEWSGGNVFQARVWPIPPNSSKRIRLSYTQVLPWRGGVYRYQYPLASDMLKQHPLERLAINVRIDSSLALERVTCPTHAARIDRSSHAAQVEFVAQSYVPERDFEIEIAPGAQQQNEAVLITHQRGDDGYFMLQIMPPGSGDGWQRTAAVDAAQPIELLVLADTSASIDAASRGPQAELIDALLNSLTPRDKFNLATCDVECRWALDHSAPADAQQTAAARQFYDQRAALGWTDLDQAFASVLERCGPQTHVVYLGDGVSTAGNADPIGFAQRLERLYQGHSGTFHAVALSSSYEAPVLKAIARLGGGSLRRVGPEAPPAAVARELLDEILAPGLKDLKVELRGLRTASVFPEQLPNVPRGSQQLVLGRYLPQATDQTCEIVVRATERGKPVEFSRRVTLAAGEEGNSFVPRLWARSYLDELLNQGNSAAIHREIIELSERYHIITPYTSLLVLESDADRARFNVARR